MLTSDRSRHQTHYHQRSSECEQSQYRPVRPSSSSHDPPIPTRARWAVHHNHRRRPSLHPPGPNIGRDSHLHPSSPEAPRPLRPARGIRPRRQHSANGGDCWSAGCRKPPEPRRWRQVLTTGEGGAESWRIPQRRCPSRPLPGNGPIAPALQSFADRRPRPVRATGMETTSHHSHSYSHFHFHFYSHSRNHHRHDHRDRDRDREEEEGGRRGGN